MVETNIKIHDQKQNPMFPEELMGCKMLTRFEEKRQQDNRAGGETTEDFYDKKTFPFFPTTIHITASVLLIGLIIFMADCTMSMCSGNLFPLEKNTRLLNILLICEWHKLKNSRWVLRNINIVHYPLNPEKHIGTYLNKYIRGTTLMI